MTNKTSLPKDNIKILLLEGVHPIVSDSFVNDGYHQIESISSTLSEEALIERIQGVHFLGIRSRTQLTANVINKANKLAGVGCFCIGTNQVDLTTAANAGIPVFNAPFANTRSVAELVIAEIIMLMRKVPERNAQCHRGQWHKTAKGSHEVRGKTLGLIGYGHIGTQVGILAESLGMQVLFYDIEPKLALGNAVAAEGMDELLAASDVVSLHVPQTPQTKNLIGHEQFAKFKHGSILINASRGNVVDIAALVKALETEQVQGAAIDVYPCEPKSNDEPFESPLQAFDNVLLTPHIGGSTLEAQFNIGKTVAERLLTYSNNGSTVGAVNFPEVSLPQFSGRARLLHIHRNIPGMLKQINEIFSSSEINVLGQYLQTTGEIGYVVMDIEQGTENQVISELKSIEGTIRARLLY